MRNVIHALLLSAVVVPGVALSAPASAQSREELRRDRQDIRQERRELDRARAYGDRRDVREQRGDLREARQEYREDLRGARGGGNGGDWRQWREGHRELYARGNWRAPFRYQTFRPGARIDARYYGPRYVIAQPGRYRLPVARGPVRWVRHYDDALLVDQRRGVVVDVIRRFYR